MECQGSGAEGLSLSEHLEKWALRPSLLLALQMQTNRRHYCFGPVKTKGVSSFPSCFIDSVSPISSNVTTENDSGKCDPIMRPK